MTETCETHIHLNISFSEQNRDKTQTLPTVGSKHLQCFHLISCVYVINKCPRIKKDKLISRAWTA